ncbi:hypothetical protein LEMLEM_LOCUS7404 [Lemmus lemmus]
MARSAAPEAEPQDLAPARCEFARGYPPNPVGISETLQKLEAQGFLPSPGSGELGRTGGVGGQGAKDPQIGRNTKILSGTEWVFAVTTTLGVPASANISGKD